MCARARVRAHVCVCAKMGSQVANVSSEMWFLTGTVSFVVTVGSEGKGQK